MTTENKKAFADLPKAGYFRKGSAPATERQLAILEIIKQFTKERGFSPTLRELAEITGIKSSNGVEDHLKRLRKRGLVTWEKYKSRTLRVVDLEEAATLKAIEEQEKAADAEARALSEASLEP
jgi:SOS-response transcriptional repressor LexA